MAEGRMFENVAVSVLQEDGSKMEKYSGSVNVHLNYDPHGLSCTGIRGGECVFDIPIESKTERFRGFQTVRTFANPSFFQPALDVWLIPNKITIIYLYNYYYVLVYSNRSVSNNILTEMHLNRQVQVLLT